MFTELEASTRLAARTGDEAAREVVDVYRNLVRSALERHGGREIQTIGDGILASFGSARDGLLCGLDIQEAVRYRDEGDPAHRFAVRIGLNAGDALTIGGNDLFGSTVHAAARVTNRAAGGEVVASEIVRPLAGPGPDLRFGVRGSVKLKGFEGRWRLYRVTSPL